MSGFIDKLPADQVIHKLSREDLGSEALDLPEPAGDSFCPPGGHCLQGQPYSLLQVFGRSRIITKSKALLYVTKCNPVEVVPRVSSQLHGGIPVTWNRTSLFVDPINYMIKSAASQTQCNNIALPW
jgi:hypothetical protein